MSETKLKTTRKKQGLTQEYIAEKAKITTANYQRYERGSQQPTLPTLIALADLFDVSLDYLVGRSDEPKRR